MDQGREADRGDRSKLIEENQNLVVSVLGQVSSRLPRHVEREELIRAGMLGLVDAAGRFEPSRGVCCCATSPWPTRFRSCSS